MMTKKTIKNVQMKNSFKKSKCSRAKGSNKEFLMSYNKMESVKERFSNYKAKTLIKLCMLFNRCRMIEDKEIMFNTGKIMRILDMEEEVDHSEIPSKEVAVRVMKVERVMVVVDMEALQVNLSTNNNF